MTSNQGKQIDTNDKTQDSMGMPPDGNEANAKNESNVADDRNGADDKNGAVTEKYRHSHYDARNYFPLFYLNFWFRIVGGLLAFMLGICLLVAGSWADSGYAAYLIIQATPFPNVEIEDANYHAMTLVLAAYVGWVCGFFLLLGCFYYLWSAFVLYELYFTKNPWNKELWSKVRIAANDFLVTGRVREESLTEQFARMNEDQQADMVQYKRTSESINQGDANV